jgi:hypothetical protein
MLSEEEDYIDDEYIESGNDPYAVEEIAEEIAISDDDEIVDFDEVLDNVRCKIVDLSYYDHMMEEKVLDALREGKLK